MNGAAAPVWRRLKEAAAALWPPPAGTRAEEREPRPSCGACLYFRADPGFIEAAMPGLAAMSSGHACVRGNDGICLRLDRYLGARSHCEHFAARRAPRGA